MALCALSPSPRMRTHLYLYTNPSRTRVRAHEPPPGKAPRAPGPRLRLCAGIHRLHENLGLPGLGIGFVVDGFRERGLHACFSPSRILRGMGDRLRGGSSSPAARRIEAR